MKVLIIGVILSMALFQIPEVESKVKVGNPLKGRHFKAATHLQPGYSVKRDKNGTIISFTGPPLKAAEWISRRLGFTYDMVLVETNYLEPFSNGSWGGSYGLLANKEVDFIFGGMAISYNVLSIVDFTVSIHEEPVVMALPSPMEESRFSAPVKPFSLTVWLLLFATILAVCFTIIGINVAAQGNCQNEEFVNLLMRNVRLLFGQGGFEGSQYTSVVKRIALAGWLLSLLVLVNAYTGSFISVATAPRLVKQPQTLQEAVEQSQYQFVVAKTARTDPYLKATTGPFKALGDSLRLHPENLVPGATQAVEKIKSGCCFQAYPKIGLELFLYNDLQATKKCNFVLTKAPWVWDFYSFATPKGSPYTTLLSKEMLHIKEYGLYAKWLGDAIQKPLKCLYPEQPKVRPLTLTDVASLFIVLCLGLGLSWVVFICELSWARTVKKKTAKK